MFLWLRCHDGSAISADKINALLFDDLVVGEDAENKPITQMFVVALTSGGKVLMQPVKNQQEGIQYITFIMAHLKKEHDRQSGKTIEIASQEEAAEVAKNTEAAKKVLIG